MSVSTTHQESATSANALTWTAVTGFGTRMHYPKSSIYHNSVRSMDVGTTESPGTQ